LSGPILRKRCRLITRSTGRARGRARREDGQALPPGQEFIYVLEGEGRIEEAGKPAVDLKPGVGVYFQSDPARPTYVHEGINLSQTKPLKLVTTLITEKGQPLAIPVK
jgi:cupin domain